MSYVPMEGVTQNHSIYKVVVLAAKRAQEISTGSPKLIEATSEKASTIALEEIAAGKVHYKTRELEPQKVKK